MCACFIQTLSSYKSHQDSLAGVYVGWGSINIVSLIDMSIYYIQSNEKKLYFTAEKILKVVFHRRENVRCISMIL